MISVLAITLGAKPRRRRRKGRGKGWQPRSPLSNAVCVVQARSDQWTLRPVVCHQSVGTCQPRQRTSEAAIGPHYSQVTEQCSRRAMKHQITITTCHMPAQRPESFFHNPSAENDDALGRGIHLPVYPCWLNLGNQRERGDARCPGGACAAGLAVAAAGAFCFQLTQLGFAELEELKQDLQLEPMVVREMRFPGARPNPRTFRAVARGRGLRAVSDLAGPRQRSERLRRRSAIITVLLVGEKTTELPCSYTTPLGGLKSAPGGSLADSPSH